MIRFSENKIIQGLKNEESKIIRFIYNKYYNSIHSMVLKFNNIILEPDDVFQEGITRLIINIRNNKFNEKSTVFTYLYSICRNICLKELHKNKMQTELNENIQNEESNDEFELLNRLLEIFNTIDEKCQNIIELRFGLTRSSQAHAKGAKFDEIAIQLKITSQNARQRFKRCLDKLREYVASDSLVAELMN